MTTTTDVGEAAGWAIADDVTQLRVLGSEQSYPLPRGSTSAWVLGSAETCSIQLNDREGRISRQHARLVWDHKGWHIHDLDSKNGIWIDGSRQSCYRLAAGTEIGLGGVLLVAESKELMGLRRLVRRMLGWSPEQALTVDRMLRSIRDAATLRAPLLLSGQGDLAPIARRFHLMTLGWDRPFIVLEGGAVRSAMAAATNGTLYVPASCTLTELPEVFASVRVPGSRVRLTVGAPNQNDAVALTKILGRVTWNELPRLAERSREIRRIFEEYLSEAAERRGARATSVKEKDILQLLHYGFDGIADIEDSAERIFAIRRYGVTDGAKQLGLTHGALSKWATRRSISP